MRGLRAEALRCRGLEPVDFHVEPAQCISISGSSGSGKTTMLRAIADLDPHQGRMFLDEFECENVGAPQWRKMVAFLPAESQWWHDIVKDHFSSFDRNLLGILGFDESVMSWPVDRLSSGERQRLALIRLLGNRPRALLLDEPTAALDASNIERVEDLIAEYRSSQQTPVIWISHDPNQIRRVAERHLVIEKGRLWERKEP